MKILLVFFIMVNFVTAQVDWVKWGKTEKSFYDESISNSINNKNENSFLILLLLKESYSFFISDLDGDNCPFYPTCSNFFVASVTETNIIKGSLMFADRFTRDTNLFKSSEHYARHSSGRLYDPINNYLLTDTTIIYYPRNKIVNK